MKAKDFLRPVSDLGDECAQCVKLMTEVLGESYETGGDSFKEPCMAMLKFLTNVVESDLEEGYSMFITLVYSYAQKTLAERIDKVAVLK